MSDAPTEHTITPRYFDDLFGASDDPWSFRTRWYEARKRAVTLAALPRERYANAYEPGCANGEFTALLAPRCDRLTASDGNDRAVALARGKLRDQGHVAVRKAWLPQDWPTSERFDLVVLSEIGYFLAPAALDALVECVKASLTHGGTVLACHWRRPIEGCALAGDAVNGRIGIGLALPALTSIEDQDFRLDVWCADPRSPAQIERLP